MSFPVYEHRITVTSEGVSPQGPLDAGVHGDEGATRLTFDVSALGNAAAYSYRVEVVDGAGAYDITPLLTVQNNAVTWDIPTGWTTAGTAALRLVQLAVDEQGHETARRYFPPVLLNFDYRDEGNGTITAAPLWQEALTRAQAALEATAAATAAAVAAAETATRAATQAELAEDSCQDAWEQVENLSGVVEDIRELAGEGDAVWHPCVTVDTALDSTSDNPLANRAVAAALNGKANAADTLRVYKTLGELGLATGSETIENIYSAMAGNSLLQCLVGASNAAIYPDQYVTLEVLKSGNARAVFRATQKLNAKTWVGAYSADGGWTGWKQVLGSDHVGATLWTGSVNTSGGSVSLDVPNIANYTEIALATDNGTRVLHREGNWFVGTSTTYETNDYGRITVVTDRIKLKAYTSSIGVFSYPDTFDDTCHVVSEVSSLGASGSTGFSISERPLVFTSIVGII